MVVSDLLVTCYSPKHKEEVDVTAFFMLDCERELKSVETKQRESTLQHMNTLRKAYFTTWKETVNRGSMEDL